jgi:cytoskeletal protein RodZ
MQDIEHLPLSAWAEQLLRARQESGADIHSLSRELLLSTSQIKGIESGSLAAFHGPGYYLRAVDKLASKFNIVLDPPVTELALTDSQLALNRLKNRPSAAPLAKNQSQLVGADTLPGSRTRNHLAIGAIAFIVLIAATGVWLANKDGWPTTAAAPDSGSMPPNQNSETAVAEIKTIEDARLAQIASSTQEQSAPAVAPVATASPSIAEPQSTQGTGLVNEPSVAGGGLQNETPTALVAAVEPEPVVEPAPLAPPIDLIEASFNADCWVEVRFLDGRLEQTIFTPEQTFSVRAAEVESLVFGNAQAVSATRAGQPFDILPFTRGGNNVARLSTQNLEP